MITKTRFELPYRLVEERESLRRYPLAERKGYNNQG